MGGGVPPIIFSEIVCWLNEYKVTQEDLRDRLILFVQVIDSVFIETTAARISKSQTEKPSDRTGSRKPMRR